MQAEALNVSTGKKRPLALHKCIICIVKIFGALCGAVVVNQSSKQTKHAKMLRRTWSPQKDYTNSSMIDIRYIWLVLIQ